MAEPSQMIDDQDLTNVAAYTCLKIQQIHTFLEYPFSNLIAYRLRLSSVRWFILFWANIIKVSNWRGLVCRQSVMNDPSVNDESAVKMIYCFGRLRATKGLNLL